MSHSDFIKKIHSLLGRFNISEIRKNASPCFPALKWKKIFEELEKEKLRFSLTNMKLIMTKCLRTETVLSLQMIYIRLSVVDVALHSRRRNWISYKMQEPTNTTFDLKNLHKDVRQGCRLNKTDCEVQSLKFGELIWISLIEKKSSRKHTLKWKLPVFCAFFLNSSYVFFNMSVGSSILNAILHALHFKSAKQLSLTGCDVRSLYTLLKKKESGPSQCVLPTYVAQEPKQESIGVDYTQHKSRESFADSCFGDGSVKLETYTFLSRDGTCQKLTNVPSSEQLKMSCSLKLASPNIFLYLKEIMKYNVVDVKNCPNEIRDLMFSGGNVVKM